MRLVEKTKTWDDNWNDIIRYVLFQDTTQKNLMMIPAGTSIIDFIDRYFIKDVSPDELMINETVRIAYYDSKGRDSGNKNVRNKYKEFDIYVKDDYLHNATIDRLQNRCVLIKDRLKYLLLKDRYIYNLHFDYEDDFDLWTKTTGYKRYHLALSYSISV